MAIEIVDLPINSMVMFHSSVIKRLPEGMFVVLLRGRYTSGYLEIGPRTTGSGQNPVINIILDYTILDYVCVW